VLDEAKLPNGVFQLVAGSAADIGKEFLEHPLLPQITFTGSTAVGKQLIEGAARQVKPLSLELGANAPVLVSKMPTSMTRWLACFGQVPQFRPVLHCRQSHLRPARHLRAVPEVVRREGPRIARGRRSRPALANRRAD